MAGDPPSPFESDYGFSRTVVVGELTMIGGTTSIDPCGMVMGTTPYEQAVDIFGKIEHELSRAGASLADVIQVRIYVTDISRGAEVGRAHNEFFGAVRPLMTMVEVSRLIDPRMLVEVEIVARTP
jgi:enamine deaminase RidA (YjgF/YER057c/UK114 family)